MLFNSKLQELLNDKDVVQHINIQRLRWLGMSFEWWRLVLLPASAVVVKEGNLVGKTRSRNPCRRLACPNGVGTQEAESPGKMC